LRAGLLAIAALLPTLAAAQPAPFMPPDPAARVALKDGAWSAVDTACPALPADAGLRQRIVDVTAEEWARFGFQVEDFTRTGLSLVARPRRGSIVPRALNRVRPGVTHRLLRLGRMEDQRSVSGAIAGYWAATPDNQAIDIQNRLHAVYGGTGWAVPWSAAFVSYVMCAAGIGDQEQFRRSEGHWAYVDQSIAAADGLAPRAIYRARDLDLGLPRPGDLVCLGRGGVDFASVEDKRRAPGEAAMHCDVVVKVDRKGGVVAMVGGNVVQSVTMSLVNIVPARHGRPARLQHDGDIPGGRSSFMIMELITGGEAALDKAPAIRRIAAP
jgi:hypothetical protein